jgi:EAL domain-containing protein (putative c-di-GMP-specific phosphodiesterase class I)
LASADASKALSIETLAEGIERTHELSLLQGERCDSGQGFLFARPLNPDDASAFLRKWVAEVALTSE